MTGHDLTAPAAGAGNDAPALDALAGEWVRVLRTTAYVAMSPADIRGHLQEHARRLVAALSGPEVDTHAASDVGTRLVAAGFTDPQSLSRTVELLATWLPGAAQLPLADRVTRLLAALAAGYTAALRDHIFDQQESLKRALVKSWQDSQRDLQASEARFAEVFNSSAVGIAISQPDGRIVRANPSLEEILGYDPGELPGRELTELFSAADQPSLQRHYQRLLDGLDPRFRMQFQLRRKDGEAAQAYLAVSVLCDTEQQPQYLATMVEDFTDEFLLTERLNYQALHDVATGLPNRHYFVSRLEEILGVLDPSAVITLLHLDLDGFSVINDGLGHRFGDRLLDVSARRLKSVVADQKAMVARLGGDEFAIVIEAGDPVPDVGVLAETINSEFAEPVYLDGVGVAVTASIGVVQCRVGGSEPAELLRAAGATLRRVRGQGSRQWAMFDPDFDATERVELRLAAELPGAMENGELSVEYQPVSTVQSPRVVGVEAILSWQHPELGVVSSQRCMQLAEQTGMVHEAGKWLLRVAAEQAVAWRERWGDEASPMMVTLAPSQAKDPDLVAAVRAVLQQTGLQPAELQLWMPAAALRSVDGMPAGQGGEDAEDNVRTLAQLGVRTGLHDFGGGIGGLRCLAELPISAVRVAEPVSRQVADDASRILSQSVHALIHVIRAAGVNVVACPVDTEEQAACWPWVGANWAVGRLFGGPGPPQDIELLLEAQVGTEARS
ncbi:MAG: EAL domain-containing protein [Pseudonocardiaceae bacterium]|nr:EAL domain-containing protein [Pseudonocardiaceae bacterium]